MGYIVVGRRKGKSNPFENMGPYEYSSKKDFGSLSTIKRTVPNFDIKIVKRKS